MATIELCGITYYLNYTVAALKTIPNRPRSRLENTKALLTLIEQGALYLDIVEPSKEHHVPSTGQLITLLNLCSDHFIEAKVSEAIAAGSVREVKATATTSLPNEVSAAIARVISSGKKAMVELGRDGIKVLEVDYKKIYPCK